jgi:hypothetical protein
MYTYILYVQPVLPSQGSPGVQTITGALVVHSWCCRALKPGHRLCSNYPPTGRFVIPLGQAVHVPQCGITHIQDVKMSGGVTSHILKMLIVWQFAIPYSQVGNLPGGVPSHILKMSTCLAVCHPIFPRC